MTHRTLLLAAWLILLAGIAGAAVFNDHQSCVRSANTRSGLHIFFTAQSDRARKRARVESGTAHTLDLQAQRSAAQAAAVEMPLDCSPLVPGTR